MNVADVIWDENPAYQPIVNSGFYRYLNQHDDIDDALFQATIHDYCRELQWRYCLDSLVYNDAVACFFTHCYDVWKRENN